MKRIIVLITLMAIALCLWTACAGEETKLVGEPFPEFAFTDADGTAYTAAGLLEGKKLLVLHVFAAWDTNGTPQLPMMEDVYRRHQDQMAFAAVAGMYEESPESVAPFREGSSAVIGVAPQETVSSLNLADLPATLFIDRSGRLACLYDRAFSKAEVFEGVVSALLDDGYDGTPVASYGARVTDETNQPVAGAEVTFENEAGTVKLLTDENGVAELPLGKRSETLIKVSQAPAGYRASLSAYERMKEDASFAQLQVARSSLIDMAGVPEITDLRTDGPYTLDNIRSYVVGLDQPVQLADGTSRQAINFDNAATTPALSPVLEEVNRQLMVYASIGRGFSQKSNHSTEMYELTRDKVLQFLNADPKKYTCFYVNNTTDGLNKLASALITSKDDLVLTTRIEHHANDLSWRERCKVVYAEVDRQGRIIYDDIEKLLKENNVKYVSVTAASNVTGYVTDVHRVAKLAHQYGARIIVDGAQIVAHRQFSMLGETEEENIDFFVFSAHKMYSPFGGGAVVGLTEVLDQHMPQFYGGGTIRIVGDDWQNYKSAPAVYEAGSPNYPGVVGMGKAIDILTEVGFDGIQAHEQVLNRHLIDGLRKMDGAIIYGDADEISDRVGVVSFNFRDVNSYLLAQKLAEIGGVSTRRGAFCANPYVWRLLGMTDDEVHQYEDCSALKTPGMIRVSFGIYNTEEEVDEMLRILPEAIEAAKAEEERMIEEGKL